MSGAARAQRDQKASHRARVEEDIFEIEADPYPPFLFCEAVGRIYSIGHRTNAREFGIHNVAV